MEIFIYLVCIIQFALLYYNPFYLIPTQKDLETGRKFINTMAQMKGEIFVPSRTYLPTLVGKNSYAHGGAIGNILMGDKGEVRAKLINEIRQAIREKRFSAIILDSHWLLGDFRKDIEEYYIKQKLTFDHKTIFWPIIGIKTMSVIYVPKINDTY